MLDILIAADICPIGKNRPYFEAGDVKCLFNDLRVEFETADLCIANLECPLIERPTPILKTGPVFGEASACINGIKQAGIDVLGLANNHIMDHGSAGLKNTLTVCGRAGISTVGAGENLAAARQILVKKVGNLAIGVLALAEHEFSIATKESWGANPLDLIDYVRNVNSQKHNFDYLIVLLHGGDEFLVPSPRIKETCRFLVEMGANAVIVQHPHCIGGYERYQGGHIVYGQGALIMDEAIYRNLESFHEGFLVKLSIMKDVDSTLEIVPYVQSGSLLGVRRMEKRKEQEFLHLFQAKSEAVRDDDHVEAEWLKFCHERKHAYVSGLLGHNRLLRKLNAQGLLTKLFYPPGQLRSVKNIVCCETHREAIETIFNQGMI